MVFTGPAGMMAAEALKEAEMNPWLAAGAGALLVSERGRQLVRRGVVYGLAQLISAGEAAVQTASETTSTAGNVASGAAHTAQHGGDSVVSALTGIVAEAKQQAHGAEPEMPPKPTATRRRSAAR
jgi:hypothetical protein